MWMLVLGEENKWLCFMPNKKLEKKLEFLYFWSKKPARKNRCRGKFQICEP
jgi:hypothetical protein